MNYIKHLNAFFSIIKNDSSLNANHVSLYLALFQYWNYNRFQNPYPVYRDNIMQLSKIGSRNTYHKCMKELHTARYIIYHAAPSKFLPVKISMTRLDNYFDKLQPHQLNIFTTTVPQPEPILPLSGATEQSEGWDRRSYGGGASHNNDTRQVSHLNNTSPNNDTGTVPNLGQNIKPNISKLRETPTHTSNQQKKITKKEDPGALIIPSRESLSRQSGRLGVGQPDYNEIKTYFEQNKYPSSEAKKFYNHYKSLGWKIQGKAPIEDWRALVEKWMVNARHWPGQQEKIPEQDIGKEIQYLYESWKEGKTIMHHLSEKHFHHLQLQLTPEIEQTAKAERIKQLSSSNQHRDLQLLMAYTSNQLDKEIILKDHSNIELIAKRIAIIYHFINTQQHEH